MAERIQETCVWGGALLRRGGEAIGREEMEHREKERPMTEIKTSHSWGQKEGEEM